MTRQVRIKRGLDVPITGEPQQQVAEGPPISRVGLLGDDYPGMKPTMAITEGDRVAKGQVLFTHKAYPSVAFTAPASGRVSGVVRGAKRRFEALIIEVEGDERTEFRSFADSNLAALSAGQVREHLLTSGMWPALRTRPFNKIPNPDSSPYAIFVTAMDTNPLAADPRPLINQNERDFVAGLEVLTTLTEGTTYLCRGLGGQLPGEGEVRRVETVEFSGPHPAGLPGTHIHFLAPVSMTRTVWHIGYQDVIAIGRLFAVGELHTERVIAVAGPAAARPRLVKTSLGASTAELAAGEIRGDLASEVRVISGSVLSGRRAAPPHDFLGRYDLALTLVEEGRRRELMGWAGPGFNKFSVKPVFVSALANEKKYAMTTSTEGSPRAIVPIGTYETVMPLDIVVVPLLKSLVMQDHETAQALGCLELAEEDLSLCTFADPGKHEFGPLLRRTLDYIEAEG
jgi:Na+-transporting NADH:ubiquinone oxidoreductase subunit A